MTQKLSLLSFLIFFVPLVARGDDATSARNFATVVEALADHDDSIADALSEVAAAAGEVESLNQQITSKRQEAQRLQQEAQQALAQANMLNNLSANQGAGGGGGGGGGGSGSGGSKGLQLKAPELPEMPEAAAFEMPSAPPGVDVGELASSLSFNSRGATSSPMDNSFPPFTGFNLPASPARTSPKLMSPGSVAAGNLPQLSGNATAGTPISPSQNASASAGGGGNAPGGGMPGGLGGGGGGGGGAASGGGDVMASVGAEPYFSEGGLRVQTQQMGESGDGGGTGASESSGGGPDESAVRAQISRGVAGTAASKEKNPNPEGKGLMAYVGFIQSSCRKAEKTMEVCKGPLLSAEKAKLAALPRVDEYRASVAAPTRTIASPPTQETYGPVRAGLLGLVSGK